GLDPFRQPLVERSLALLPASQHLAQPLAHRVSNRSTFVRWLLKWSSSYRNTDHQDHRFPGDLPYDRQTGCQSGSPAGRSAPRVGISAVPLDDYLDHGEDAHACFSSWRRVSDNVIPPRGKLAGSYVNSALAKTDAVLAGFDEAIMLNDAGHVCEGSVENLFIV